MVKKIPKRNNESKKVPYKKPFLRKEGSLRDITAGGSVMIISPNRKSKK